MRRQHLPDMFRERAASVVSLAANICCLLSIMLKPYMPVTSQMILKQLNMEQRLEDCMIPEKFVQFLPIGHGLGEVLDRTCYTKI